jgi:hypothetical protein
MKNHTKVYLKEMGFSTTDFIPCEVCGGKAGHTSHRTERNGWKQSRDNIENLMALCRTCHHEADFGTKLNKDYFTNTQPPPFKKSYLIMKRVPISQVIPNPTNPRIIKDDKFKKLVKSIEEFPQMLELRPIVVDSNMVVLGGNMRLKACIAAGLKEVPIIVADQLTDAQKGEFIIKDNVGFGEWDWDLLANEWDVEALTDWGLELPFDNTPVLEAEEDDYEAPSEIKTDIVLGDLIEIGNHRLAMWGLYG